MKKPFDRLDFEKRFKQLVKAAINHIRLKKMIDIINVVESKFN